MVKKSDIAILARSTIVHDDCFIATSLPGDRDKAISRIEALLSLARGKRVLHIGCCDHIDLIDKKIKNQTWLHGLLTKVAKECYGIDIDPIAIEHVKKLGYYDVYNCDLLYSFPTQLQKKNFDVVILGEILEHLDSPVAFLKKLYSYIKSDYELVLTVPNAFFLENFINVLGGFERINSDHRAWYTAYTISKVLSLGGYDVKSFEYVFRGDSSGYIGSSKSLLQLYKHPECRDVLLVCATPQAKNDKVEHVGHVGLDLTDGGALVFSRVQLSKLCTDNAQSQKARDAIAADRDKAYAQLGEAWKAHDAIAADRDKAYAQLGEAWKARDAIAADRDKAYAQLGEAWKARDAIAADRDKAYAQLGEAWKAHDAIAADRDKLDRRFLLSQRQIVSLEAELDEMRSRFLYKVSRLIRSFFEVR